MGVIMFGSTKNDERVKAQDAALQALRDQLEQVVRIVEALGRGTLNEAQPEQLDESLAAAFTQMRDALATRLGETAMNSGALSKSAAVLNDLSEQLYGLTGEVSERIHSVNVATSEIDQRAGTVSDASELLTGGMAELAQRADEITEHIMSVSSATEEMTSTITEIAGTTEQTRMISEQSTAGIQLIAEKMAKLGEAAAEIYQVIDVITDISEQTKLLALNATIEAARAGEAGKGFAVVAGEVKELAKQTNASTSQIKARVEAISNATKETREEIGHIDAVINDLNAAVTTIAAAVEEQSVTTKDIAGSVSDVSGGVADMSDAIKSAYEKAADINGHLNGISEQTGQISGAVDEVTGMAEEMRKKNTTAYATSLEIGQICRELEDINQFFKLPAGIARDGQERSLIRWTDSLSVEVKQIDGQHQRIIDYINTIHEDIKKQVPMRDIRQHLGDMAAFVVGHFATEEKYMRQFHYKLYDEHHAIHEDLLAKVRMYVELANSEESVNLIKVQAFLTDWLINHILGEDKKYVGFMHEHDIY